VGIKAIGKTDLEATFNSVQTAVFAMERMRVAPELEGGTTRFVRDYGDNEEEKVEIEEGPDKDEDAGNCGSALEGTRFEEEQADAGADACRENEEDH
jgi:hypothetical protein